MRDINQPSGDNLGGALRFNFIPVSDVLEIGSIKNGEITQVVTLKEGKNWFAGYGTQWSINYTETDQESNAGTLYKRQFTAICPQDGSDNTALFDEMRNNRFIVDYVDSNGLRKLVGSIDEPLKFSAVLSTKTNMSELAGHTITFFGDGSRKAPVYNI